MRNDRQSQTFSPQLPQFESYTNYTSKAIADDASTHILQWELQEHVVTFQVNGIAFLNREAEAELSYGKNEPVQNLIMFGLDVTKLYLACQEHTTPCCYLDFSLILENNQR